MKMGSLPLVGSMICMWADNPNSTFSRNINTIESLVTTFAEENEAYFIGQPAKWQSGDHRILNEDEKKEAKTNKKEVLWTCVFSP